MSDEFLTKEEIRRWRSSVEKITLEDYAARLGKKIQESKKTNDLADMVYKNYNPSENVLKYDNMAKLEKIDLAPKLSFVERKHNQENTEVKKETKIAVQKVEIDEKPKKIEKVEKVEETEEVAEKDSAKTKSEKTNMTKNKSTQNTEPLVTEKVEKPKKTKPQSTDKVKLKIGNTEIEFTKPLTDREEKVLEYFIKRKGEIVFAKDLAELLELKRDYIYKYIKNLRAKMTVDLIANADNGGFKFS